MISRFPGVFPNLDRAFLTHAPSAQLLTRCTASKMTVFLSWRHTPWLVLSILSLISYASSHMIEVTASRKECFFEDLHEHDQMTVTYQVGEGGHLDIDFWVCLMSKLVMLESDFTDVLHVANRSRKQCSH